MGHRVRRALPVVAVVAVGLLVATVGVFLAATRDQVSDHCLTSPRIGALYGGFSAPASVVDRTVLVARARPDQAAQLRVGLEASVPDTMAEAGMRAWVVTVDGTSATITLRPPPSIAVVTPTPPANLRLGATGDVMIYTVSISKGLLRPTAALRPVPGRPGLVTARVYPAPAPPHVAAFHLRHAVGPDADIELVDPATAVSVGADPEPGADQGAYIVADHFCRTARLWPPVLDHDVYLEPAP